jgi:uncharacterized protein (TIGR02118 family)
MPHGELPMSANDTRVVIYVIYTGEASDRFDRDYYDATHLPLVMDAWAKYGLLGTTAFFPSQDRIGTIALCECVFRDEAALEAAFASPEAAAVMADVIAFTDLIPTRVRAAPL